MNDLKIARIQGSVSFADRVFEGEEGEYEIANLEGFAQRLQPNEALFTDERILVDDVEEYTYFWYDLSLGHFVPITERLLDAPWYFQLFLARKENHHGDTLDRLARLDEPGVRLAIIRNAAVTPGALRFLSEDRNPNVRFAVAKHPQTPIDVLQKLSLNKETLGSVASNENATPEILRQIGLSHVSRDVDASLAGNKQTPSDTLRAIYGRMALFEPNVRLSLASNPNSPLDVLASLFETFLKSDDRIRPTVLRHIANNPSTPLDLLLLLEQIMRDNRDAASYDVVLGLTSNKNAPPDMLRRISAGHYYSNLSVKQNIAKNPNAPLDVLEKMSNTRDWELKDAVRNHPTYQAAYGKTGGA